MDTTFELGCAYRIGFLLHVLSELIGLLIAFIIAAIAIAGSCLLLKCLFGSISLFLLLCRKPCCVLITTALIHRYLIIGVLAQGVMSCYVSQNLERHEFHLLFSPF